MKKLPSNIILVGVNELQHFKKGWHQRFKDAESGIDYCATQKSALFEIKKEEHHSHLIFVVNAAVETTHKPFKASVRINNETIGNFLITKEGWTVKDFNIDRFPPGILKGEIKNYATFIPDEYLHNGDQRQLGVYISAIRLK